MQCTHCGQAMQPGQKFCANCGGVLPQPAPRRKAPWKAIGIGGGIVLLLGLAGFLYFLQVTREVVLWVDKMTPDEENAVVVANRFLDLVNAGKLQDACAFNENGAAWCMENESQALQRLTAGGGTLKAIYADKDEEIRGAMAFNVVVKYTHGGKTEGAWLQVAPGAKGPIYTGPYTDLSWYNQMVRRLEK